MPIRVSLQSLLLAAAVAWTGMGCAPGEPSASRTETLDFAGSNLLVITLDTVRADRLGAYGYGRGMTPNLDRLAAGGVRFENAFAPVPLTLPTHTTLFTGLYPFATGVRINGMHFVRNQEVTLAERFKARGYTTAAFVSAYVMTEKFGLAQGFDTYDDQLATPDTLFRFYSETPADEVANRFSDWLRGHHEDRFFGWLHFYDAHQPYAPPPPFDTRFAGDPYDGEIAFVDQQIGRVLESLERHGIANKTVLVITADHGEAFGEHVEQGHGLLTYNETLRVPLIVVAPERLAPDRTVDTRVGLVDIAPTLVELFGLASSTTFQGQSLAPILRQASAVPAAAKAPVEIASGPANEPRNVPIYFESQAGMHEKNWAPRAGLIVDGYKYIRVPEPELYDLESDPGETRNLAADERARIATLDRQLRTLLESVPEPLDAERELSAPDRRQLEALGYLSSSGYSDRVIDPKRGIEIEMRSRRIRDLARSQELDRANELLVKLRRDFSDVEVIDFYELDFEIRSQRGDETGAVAALERGMARLPQSVIGLKLASYLQSIGRLDEAEREARRLLEDEPRSSQAESLLGVIAESRGDLEAAVDYFELALAHEPRSVPLELKIAEVRARRGEHAKATAIYDRLDAAGNLDRHPEHLFKAAAVYSITGNSNRAEELFERGLAIKPAGRHYIALAVVQLSAGNPVSALRNLTTALEQYREQLQPQEIALAETLRAQLNQGRPQAP